MNKKIIGIIPARMESSRFPGKPLEKIHGIPMIGHVYHRSNACSQLDELWVATCNIEIKNYIERIGGNAIMTSNLHERASDRIAEALNKIEKMRKMVYDIIVLIQGDEPMLVPDMIKSAVDPLINSNNVEVSNLMSKLQNKEEHDDPNEVKVVVDKQKNALYFSREPIPSGKKYDKDLPMFKQVCIIPFKRECLLSYTKLKPTPLEIIESVDMNRLLENGKKVRMVYSDYKSYAVDTKEDLIRVESIMKSDSLMKDYI